jgi:RNA polymerase sigma-70 factor (ECF subfamily)
VDNDGFRRQLGALLPRLFRFALTLSGGSRADADDLVQMTCERALSRLAQWHPDTRLDSWMFRIMQTVWFNELRSRRARREQPPGDDGPLRAAAGAPGPHEISAEDGERAAEARLLLGRVEEEMLRLPDKERAILLLVCVEGLTYKEAAEILSVPIGTVMSRLARARLNLMRRIDAEGRPGAADNVVRLMSAAPWKS